MRGRGAYETPQEACPYCSTLCDADWCDVGVGYVQSGPYHCTECGASEVGPHDDYESRPDYDIDTGWYKPGAPAGSSANVDDLGNIIGYKEADTL